MVTISSAQVTGLDAAIITVEADLSPGLHIFSIVGLADKEVQESRERIGSAIRNIGARPPHKKSERLIVNLAPADLKKEGPAFDLPIALAFLLASGQTRFDPNGKLFLGELGLDGALRPVAGVLPIVITARLAGFHTVYVPVENGCEASLVDGITVKAAPDLASVLADLESRAILPAPPSPPRPDSTTTESAIDFSDIHGQEHAKRALEIAAAGGHNVLLQGPPGTGKTVLARALTGILPAMDDPEMIEVTKIASIAGITKDGLLIRSRPFRSPHHTTSAVAITGGGSSIRPGEVTLAHRGVLFLDELPEFPPSVLEALRQPLEDRVISISRASGSVTFPADFILIGAMNPCPCGNLSNPNAACICSAAAILKYQRRISGPLLDRIDLIVDVGPVDVSKLDATPSEHSESAAARERVRRAREIQRARFSGTSIRSNGAMTLRELKRFCRLDPGTRAILHSAYERFGLSVRSYYRLVKLARTIADLAGADRIGREHIMESLQYRPRAEV